MASGVRALFFHPARSFLYCFKAVGWRNSSMGSTVALTLIEVFFVSLMVELNSGTPFKPVGSSGIWIGSFSKTGTAVCIVEAPCNFRWVVQWRMPLFNWVTSGPSLCNEPMVCWFSIWAWAVVPSTRPEVYSEHNPLFKPLLGSYWPWPACNAEVFLPSRVSLAVLSSTSLLLSSFVIFYLRYLLWNAYHSWCLRWK